AAAGVDAAERALDDAAARVLLQHPLGGERVQLAAPLRAGATARTDERQRLGELGAHVSSGPPAAPASPASCRRAAGPGRSAAADRTRTARPWRSRSPRAACRAP